ncbi:MAG: hypothetical protein DCC75_06070 [Proteobacteria bacterium]|nr:MAG: hypothetical protein DCC75_06070 [Pseudomonadota bacterium]
MRLKMAGNQGSPIVFELKEGDNLIGRLDAADKVHPEIDLEPYDFDAKVSRRHALISRKGSIATVEDLGSLNGTFVNRSLRLERGVRYELRPGDELLVGRVIFKFENAP